jgi:diguanylate cyclase (GGDEF)-like protein
MVTSSRTVVRTPALLIAMDVDQRFIVLSLLTATSIVAGLGCIVLIVVWRQMHQEPVILWWAGSLLARTVAGVVLVAGFGASVGALIIAGSALMPLGATATWIAARVFHSRSAPPQMFILVLMTWLAGLLLPFRGGVLTAAFACALALDAIMLLGAAFELWRGRAEKLTARWPLIAVTGFHAALLAIAAVVAAGDDLTHALPPMLSWFSLVQLELIMFLLASAALCVMLVRERMDASLLAQARIDSLTGVANRGTFLEQAERIFRRAAKETTSVSAIIFDLDHFKTINDTYGHAAGDRVLRQFADTSAELLRLSDLFGRIGGEEFCAILPNTGVHAAYVIAERIRRGFETTPVVFGNNRIHATVSAGVATSDRNGAAVEVLIQAADSALYRAKSHGRNRVERADRKRSPETIATVSRAVDADTPRSRRRTIQRVRAPKP